MGSSPAPQSPQHPAGLNMPGKEAIPIGCSAIKPVERHGWEAVSWFLYDKNTGAIMGRTPLSWLLITIFYIIYYAFLAGFWALMLIFNKNKMKDGRTIPGYAQWVGRTDKFLEESGYKTTHANDSVTRKEELTILEDCNGVEDKDYGYSSGNPCV